MRKTNLAEMRRLSGVGNSYDSWTQPKATKSVVSLNEARIRRLANVLEEEGYGGRRDLPHFDAERIDQLMEEAASDAGKEALAHHHWNARYASAAAHETDKAGHHSASHEHHLKAAEMHHKAAQHLAAGGDAATARVHSQWAAHHEAHAAHHAKAMAPKESPAPAKAKGKKEPEHEVHAKRAQQAARVTQHLYTDPSTSHKELAMAHHDAAHEHLHAALSHFHAGKHEQAMGHFNAAIHHMNKHHENVSAAKAKRAHADRVKAGGGPRAQAGRAHV